MDDLRFRAPGEQDHRAVVAALHDWWGEDSGTGGELRAALVPRWLFQHFTDTSLVVHDGDRLAAFLVGFLSQSRPDEAYIHFVGVDPDHRGRGIATELYGRFFALARHHDRTTVRAITSTANVGSQMFHRRLGFSVSGPVADYDGRGGERVLFARSLDDNAADRS